MEAQTNQRWEGGRAPLIGRLYEVESMREVSGLSEIKSLPENADGTPNNARYLTPPLQPKMPERKVTQYKPASETVLPLSSGLRLSFQAYRSPYNERWPWTRICI